VLAVWSLAKVTVIFDLLAAHVAAERLATWTFHLVATLLFEKWLAATRTVADHRCSHVVGDAVACIGLLLFILLDLDFFARLSLVRSGGLTAVAAVCVVAFRTGNDGDVGWNHADIGAVGALAVIVKNKEKRRIVNVS